MKHLKVKRKDRCSRVFGEYVVDFNQSSLGQTLGDMAVSFPTFCVVTSVVIAVVTPCGLRFIPYEICIKLLFVDGYYTARLPVRLENDSPVIPPGMHVKLL